MKTYMNISTIANSDDNDFMCSVDKILMENEKKNFKSEIHYSYANGVFTALIIGYMGS